MSVGRTVRLPAPLLAIVCRKCAKRVGAGGKPGKQIARAVRTKLGHKVQVAEVGCLKLCPKRHVVVVAIGAGPYLVEGDAWCDQATALLVALQQSGKPVELADAERFGPALRIDAGPVEQRGAAQPLEAAP